MYQAVVLFLVFLLRGNSIYASAIETTPGTTDSTTQNDDEVMEEVPSTHVPKLLSTAHILEATVGESVSFPCDVEDLGDFVILWKRENHRILFAGDVRINRDDRIKTNGTTLHVRNVNSRDSGEYTCQLSTNPPIELTHTLDVLYPPTVRSRPKEGFITAKEGETVTLICDATGNPPPTVMWKHAGKRYNSFDESNYIINDAQKDDSGEYECIADNSIGDPASTTITVEIVSAPKVFPDPKTGLLVIKEGEPISIGCEATGDPKPLVSWLKPNGEKMLKSAEDNKIMIKESTRNDAGTYECIANNSLGISTSAHIRVQVLYPPKIRIPVKAVHAREGVSVNFTCIVEGEPSPTVIWKRGDGEIIHSSEDYFLRNQGHAHVLIIPRLQEKDFGQYECTASNSLSSASEKAHLIGKPQVPVFTSKPHSTQGTKYTISWKSSSSTPIDEYSLMYRKRSDKEEWTTKSVPASNIKDEDAYTQIQMFQLMELQPATEYEAIVKAMNKFGWSDQSEALIFTTKSEGGEELELIPTSGETTEATTITDNSISAMEEKQMQNYSSSSTRRSVVFSLLSWLPLIFISKHIL